MNPGYMAALVSVATLAFGVMPAVAGPCTKEIAAFEQSVRAAGKNPGAGPTARQSVAATLSRQPTRKSVEQAEQQAQESFNQALARAKALDAQGKRTECTQALSRAKAMYNLQ
jgi:hypothetical protein